MGENWCRCRDSIKQLVVQELIFLQRLAAKNPYSNQRRNRIATTGFGPSRPAARTQADSAENTGFMDYRLRQKNSAMDEPVFSVDFALSPLNAFRLHSAAGR